MNKAHLYILLVLGSASTVAPFQAIAQVQSFPFNIKSQTLDGALRTFAKTTHLQIMFDRKLVAGKHAAALAGTYSANEALRVLLAGSGLEARTGAGGVYVVQPANPAVSAVEPAETAAQGATEIVVTGSRIQRAGFDQPTPTTVIGDTEMRMGARPNIAQVLNDLPSIRPSVTPASSAGNTQSGQAPVDLRGLGITRTLSLLDGRRFVAGNDLNLIPSALVSRVEVVTGGASAAYGSGAMAGVVNIILKKDLSGLTLDVSNGVSSRGDGERYSASGSYGGRFADGAGHFMAGVEYVDDHGILDRNSRENLGSAGIVRVSPGSTTNLSTVLVRDVNDSISRGGAILTGVLAGQTFNSDGTLRPFRGPNAQGVGGADAVGTDDDIVAASPFSRLNAYGRLSYDVGKATIWIDAMYGRSRSHFTIFPDLTITSQTLSATNAYLLPQYQAQLAAAGQTSFTINRDFDDNFGMVFDGVRESKQASIGIDGTIGNSNWRYSAFYTHGQMDDEEKFLNSRIDANYARAVDAVKTPSGQIVCAVNADANPANDDPACAPLNLLGTGVASTAALNYVRGTQEQHIRSTLDEAAAQIQGNLIQLPAGLVTIAAGGEFRRESEHTTLNAQTATAGYFSFPLFEEAISGSFTVKEGFAETLVPVVNIPGKFKLDLNGATRYSDYSYSGSIWSWKVGGTARILKDVLLRATKSRDIRAPGIEDLFAARSTNISAVSDQDNPQARAAANAGYNATPSQVFVYEGGNANLKPEVSRTVTAGGTYTPSFVPGLQLSADYYNIDIRDAIVTLSGTQVTLACNKGSQAACGSIIRNAAGTITTIFANENNISRVTQDGWDFEASYSHRLDLLSSRGTVRLRALATHINSYIRDTGVAQSQLVGYISNSRGLPSWRGNLSATYQDDRIGFDVRARYVGGGLYDPTLSTLVNNKIDARTYIDLGVQVKVASRLTVYGNVNNLFDVAPPISPNSQGTYDVVGTYVTFGAKISL